LAIKIAVGVMSWLSLPSAGFYLCALWSLGSFFSRSDEAKPFGKSMVKTLRDTGRSSLAGALCAIAIVPFLSVWIVDGFRGAHLFMLSRSGGQMRTELQEIV
jgi:hypothetical protein